LPSAIMTAGFGAILYSPVIFVTNGLRPLISNEFVEALPADVFFSQIYPHFAEVFADYSRDLPGALLWFCAILVALGLYSAARRRNWAVLLILPATLVASAALFLVKAAIPYPRTWIYIIPLVLLVADAGWTYGTERLTRRAQGLATKGLALAAVFYGVFLISTNAISKYQDTGNFAEAPLVASFLESAMDDYDSVDGVVPVDYTTFFYLWYNRMGDVRPRRDHPAEYRFYIVKKGSYSIEETTNEPVVKLFEIDDAIIYRSLTRSDRRASRSTGPRSDG